VEEEEVTVWGWSRDGKVAISQRLGNSSGANFGIRRVFIFDTVNDSVLWESKSDKLYGADSDGIYTAFIDNFHRVCRQQYAIVIEQCHIETLRKIIDVFWNRYDYEDYNRYYINIDVIPRNSTTGSSFSDTIESYSAYITSGSGLRKTLLTRRRNPLLYDPLLYENISIYGYCLGPDERVLIIIKGEWYYMDGGVGYDYTGCNLKVGF
jgi:hypothetical protein